MKRTLLMIVALPFLLQLAACGDDAPAGPGGSHPLADSLPIDSRDFRIGTAGFVPRNWPNPTNTDWEVFFDQVPEYGELFGVHGAWNDRLTEENIPEQVEFAYTITEGKGTTPYIALGFEPDGMTQNEADNYFEVNGEAFMEVAVAIAEKHHPGILLLGVESNRFWEKSPSGFADFIKFYRWTYDAVKSVSPQTKVGTNFQYEFMLGEARRSGPHDAHLFLIDSLAGKLDLITITLYPWFEYDTPASLPDNYFAPLREHTSAPLMITETGWPSGDYPDPTLAASERSQVDYLVRLLEMLEGESVEGLIWVFPNDANSGIAGGIFDAISLRGNNGEPKEVWDWWQGLRSL